MQFIMKPKHRRIILSLITTFAIFIVSSCSTIETNNEDSSEDLSTEDTVLHEDVTTHDTSPQQEIPQEAIDFALTQAKFFRTPINSTINLYDDANLFSFLITTVFSHHKSEHLVLEDISENDWNKQYLVPNEYLEQAALLYLGMENDLPNEYYDTQEYGYISQKDAFQYSPYAPPMYVTSCTETSINSDGTYGIAVDIFLIEETTPLEHLIYTYKPIINSDWGTLYQLVTISK